MDKTKMQQMWEQSIQLPGLYTFDEALAACPPGYRLPTGEEQEWLIDNTEYSFDEEKGEGVFRFADDFELRLPAAGYRYGSSGTSNLQGTEGHYWSSSVSGTLARSVYFLSGTVNAYTNYRAYAFSVRCVPIEVSTKGKPLDGMLNQTDNLDDRMRQIFIRNGVPILDLNQLSDEDLQEWLSLKKQSSELVNRIRKLINKR